MSVLHYLCPPSRRRLPERSAVLPVAAAGCSGDIGEAKVACKVTLDIAGGTPESA
jgi:hypothetical protein